ncbi:phosphatidylinositol 3-kinase regulatory subunit alpha-like [Xenia sp. Carnegie-2017]|uniref:phosphatidylinositol 3-kinase regulatory subunit alpha-like n=1 Tax=Xenia sp. Carnegie-2017 TaxID=2897299 RepID=UPI001F038F7F|nr:phosphatidylinositol 3-kinase regulatory subunit alpha-like [Xenia sp. Carnegie-2017]
MNMLKPDLWKLELKREKYMLFLEERNMKPEEIEILAGITDFALYEFPLTDEEESVDLSPEYWLFGELDRETIKNYLENTPDGTFLVRESTRNRGMKAVSIMFDGQIQHFCVEEGPEGFGFAEGFKNHPTLQSFVEYYHRVLLQMHKSSVATTLRMPVRLVKLDLLPCIGSTP